MEAIRASRYQDILDYSLNMPKSVIQKLGKLAEEMSLN